MINRPTVLITRKIPINGIEILRSKYNVIINNKDRPLTRNELIKNVKNIDAILCVLQDKIDKEIIDIAGPNLKIISTFSTGYEHIDIESASKKGIRVAYTGNILTETTADLAFGLILCLGRRILEADRYVRELKWKNGWCPELMLGTDIHNKVLGLVGFGKIGKAISKRAMGFDMEIIYYNRNRRIAYADKNVKYCELKELVSIADYIVISCSLNEDSYHLINMENLKLMKKTAFLINISRGKIIKKKI